MPELKTRQQSGTFDTNSRLLSSSAACRRLLEVLPSAVLLVDGHGAILHANRRASLLLERDPEELEGMNVEQVVAPLSVLFGEGDGGQGPRHRVVSPSGHEQFLGCRVAVAEQALMDDISPRYLVVFDDETSWVRLQSERDRLLRLAAMGEVLPSVLHELKNPLAAVTALVEVLLEESPEGPLRDDLHAIISELRRMRLAMDGVGTMGAKLASDRFQAIDHALEETCRVLTQAAVGAGVSLRHEISSMPLLALESSVIRAVLFNLIQNAIQACRAGGEVRVTGWLEEPWLVVSVADNGHGMSSDVLARCRDLFFSTKVRGSGIGLSLCHQICTESGGELQIESTEGEGTRITARVPARSRIHSQLPPSSAAQEKAGK